MQMEVRPDMQGPVHFCKGFGKLQQLRLLKIKGMFYLLSGDFNGLSVEVDNERTAVFLRCGVMDYAGDAFIEIMAGGRIQIGLE